MRLLNNTGHMKTSLKGNEMINIRTRMSKVVIRTTAYTAVGFAVGYYVGRKYDFKVVVKKVNN